MRALVCVALALLACGGTRDRTSRRDLDGGDGDDRGDGGDHAPADLARSADLTATTPAPCPCALGSYCDHANDVCVVGCLGNDHCPTTEICDTAQFQCRQACTGPVDCAGNRDCEPLASGVGVCAGCLEGFGDCNDDPKDGCEAKLDSLANCGGCAEPAMSHCLVDQDGDHYGVQGTQSVRCTCGSGYTYAQGTLSDCDDADPLVHPGQQQWVKRTSVGGANDFDCDGIVEKAYPYGKACDAWCDSPIWVDEEPACGEVGVAIHCKYDDTDDSCGYSNYTFEVVQACR